MSIGKTPKDVLTLYKTPKDVLTLSKTPKESVGFLDKLSDIMSDPQFRNFIEEYFETIDDVKTVLMMIKTYSLLRSNILKNTGVEPTKEEMVQIMRSAIGDKEFRVMMVDSLNNFMEIPLPRQISNK